MASSKEKLAQNVKNWLQIDKEIQILQKELKTNEIDCFDISEGKILYTQSNVKKPINKQHLEACLAKYFEKNPNIPTDDVVQYILENRATNVKESIRHKPTKNV